MKIFLDLDNVLIVPKFVDAVSDKLGLNISEQDITVYNFENFPDKVRSAIFQCFDDPEIMCENYTVIEGVQDWIREKSAIHDIYVITARRETIKDATVKLIRENFPQVKGIFFEHEKTRILSCYQDVIFVDDGPGNIESAIESGICCYLVSNKYTKYNHYMLGRPGVNHIKALTDLKEL